MTDEPRESLYERLERTMRRVRRLRELQGPAEVIERDLVTCRALWERVPPAPAGTTQVWPEDLRALAAELGFSPDTRAAAPMSPEIAAGIAAAQRDYATVRALHDAIAAAIAIDELHVTASADGISITGIVDDAAARVRVDEVAAAHGHARVRNALTTRR